MVRFSYHNNTIFHLKYLIKYVNKILQYIFMILQHLCRTAQDDTFDRSYTKNLSYL